MPQGPKWDGGPNYISPTGLISWSAVNGMVNRGREWWEAVAEELRTSGYVYIDCVEMLDWYPDVSHLELQDAWTAYAYGNDRCLLAAKNEDDLLLIKLALSS